MHNEKILNSIANYVTQVIFSIVNPPNNDSIIEKIFYAE